MNAGGGKNSHNFGMAELKNSLILNKASEHVKMD